MILPLLSNRKHSVPAVRDRRRLSAGSTSVELHESWRRASGEGGASARLDATWVHTASTIGSNTGTATPPPVDPLPSVPRRPPPLPYPSQTATVTSLVKPTNHASFSSSDVPVLPATYGERLAMERAVPRATTPCNMVFS